MFRSFLSTIDDNDKRVHVRRPGWLLLLSKDQQIFIFVDEIKRSSLILAFIDEEKTFFFELRKNKKSKTRTKDRCRLDRTEK